MRPARIRFGRVCMMATGLAAVALSPDAAAGQQPQKCFLWTVTTKTATVHLLGTMHIARESMYPLPKEIEGAFDGSRLLAVEGDPARVDKGKFKEILAKKLYYPDGETLSKSLSAKTMDLFRRHCERHNLKVEDYERLRPWWVDLALPGVGPPPDGWGAEWGMDKHFLKKATDQKKGVVELETVEAALWSASLSAELQEVKLFNTLMDHQDGVKFPLKELGQAWQDGDMKVVEDIAVGQVLKRHPEYRGVLEKLLDERKGKMVDKIEDFLRAGDTVFVAVGAGHLVGPRGIVRQLEDKGYRITQVTHTPVVKK